MGSPLRPPASALLAGVVAVYSGISDAQMQSLLTLTPVREFMDQLSQGELARLRLCNVNRGRYRRRMRHYLSDWAPLQDLAENLDMHLQRAGYLEPGMGLFGAWTLQRTLRDMVCFLIRARTGPSANEPVSTPLTAGALPHAGFRAGAVCRL